MNNQFPNHAITADGRVFLLGNFGGKEITPQINKYGQPRIRVVVDGTRKWLWVNKMVCLEFHGPQPSDDHRPIHKDGNPANCRARNLKWGLV